MLIVVLQVAYRITVREVTVIYIIATWITIFGLGVTNAKWNCNNIQKKNRELWRVPYLLTKESLLTNGRESVLCTIVVTASA